MVAPALRLASCTITGRLMALDVAQLDIPPRAKCQTVQRAAEPHKLAEATLVGTYPR
ncbi:MAG: hypothetical protein ACXU9D_24525 [Xanthobacteraceae bacterium]